MKLRKPSSARKSASWNRRAWLGLATCRSSRSCAREKKLGATILALAEVARNIRSVAGQIRKRIHRRGAEVAEKKLWLDLLRSAVNHSFQRLLGVSAVQRFFFCCRARETSSPSPGCVCAASIRKTSGHRSE